ncbi:MAG TPA: hypothetical protein VJ724_13270, partial [Tahibacter sp.]|nr:hypothetical protein [Tahibacter sp.]
ATAGNPLWAWRMSSDAQIGAQPQLYAPWDDPANWQTDADTRTLSAFVQGTVDCTKPGWINYSSTGGALGFAGSTTTDATFDATGLAAGTYRATLCLTSNASNAATLPVPLTFVVPNGGLMPPTLTKAFAPTSVVTDVPSTLTLTLANTGGTAVTLTSALTDTFPTDLVVAPTPNAATTCPSGTVTATAGAGSASLSSGAQIPANGTCTVTVDVVSATPNAYVNTIAAGGLQTSAGSNAAAATATLTVTEPPSCTTGSAVEAKATAGTTGPTGYTTVKAAFDAVNAGTHQGVVNLTVCADTTETASAVLNATGSGSASYTAATLKPAGGAARTVSGAIVAGSPLIDLAGATNVTIDGVNAGGNALTLSNTTVSNTAGTSTIRFINGASNNAVRRTTVLGSSGGAVGTATGNILFSTSTVAGGNSNNTIAGNDIGPAGANLPTKGVMSLGSAAANANTGNVVDANDIHDFFSPTTGVAGISINSNNTGWTISGNRIWQSAPRTFTATAQRYAGINLTASTGSFTVTGNRIGFANAAGTGTTTITGSTNTFRGIDAASTSTTVLTTIADNVIAGISQTTAVVPTSTTGTNFVGIMAGSTDGLIALTGNTVGSLDGSATIVVETTAGAQPVVGIYNFSNVVANVSNNRVGSITVQGTGTGVGFRGILVNTSSSQLATIVGNTVANVTDTQVGGYAMYGIQTTLPPVLLTDNVVRNFAGNANPASVVMSGIASTMSTSNAASTIARNTIHSLRDVVGGTGAAAGAIYAIDLALGTQANVVERNLVHSLSVDSTFTAYQLYGMILRGNGTQASTATVRNNMIRLGLDAAGNAITTPYAFVGIRDSAGTNVANQYYHNSIYIGGSGVASPGSNTYAFNSDTVTTTRNFQNNIFWNARSNVGTGGTAHVAIRLGGTASNPPGTTSNYNVILADGNDGVTGVFNAAIVPTLADWQTATGQDANSVAANPQFVAPSGDAATGDLHINPGVSTPVEGTGLLVPTVTDDFDGQTRSGLTPTDIGADAGNFMP